MLADDTTPYTYDANGNLISDGAQCFIYNDANQLAAVRTCATNTLIAEYVYDHTGQRIIEKHYQNGALQETVYTIGKQAETVVAAGGARQDTTYFRANSEIVARKSPDGSQTFYHQDHLGSTGALTNAGGQVVEETRYYPFGMVRTGGALSRFLYTGQESDTETGLYYYGARFYDPALARFVQPDSMLPEPYDPQQLNRYSYVINNPLVYTDPTGNWPSKADIKSAWNKLTSKAKGAYNKWENKRDNFVTSRPAFVNALVRYGKWTAEHSQEIETVASVVDGVPIVGDMYGDIVRYAGIQMGDSEFVKRQTVNTVAAIAGIAALYTGNQGITQYVDYASNATQENWLYGAGDITTQEYVSNQFGHAWDLGFGMGVDNELGKLGFKTHYARANPFGKAWFFGPSELYRKGAWLAGTVADLAADQIWARSR